MNREKIKKKLERAKISLEEAYEAAEDDELASDIADVIEILEVTINENLEKR